MARIRTIKPEFWTDERLTECSMSARLMFIGILNFADDNGNLAYSAKRLKMQVFPADVVDVQPLLNELLAHGMLIEYSVNGEKFLHIKGFRKHQVINRPSKTSIPMPDFQEDSLSTHGADDEDSLTEGKGKEGKGEEGKGNSEANASGGKPPEPVDKADFIFHLGVPLLTTSGVAEKQARSFLGLLCKSHGQDAVVEKLGECVREKPLQPLEWLAAALPRKGGARRKQTESFYEQNARAARERVAAFAPGIATQPTNVLEVFDVPAIASH